jgi:hypothetical protein
MALQQVARVGLPARLPRKFRRRLGTMPTSFSRQHAGGMLPPALACALPPRCRCGKRAGEFARESGGDADRFDRHEGERRARDKAAPTRATLWQGAASEQAAARNGAFQPIVRPWTGRTQQGRSR